MAGNGGAERERAVAKLARFCVWLKGKDDTVGRNPGKGRGRVIR